MARPIKKKLELTPIQVPSTERPKWRKIYKGKKYHFRGTYQEALTAWTVKKAELETHTAPDREAEDSKAFERFLAVLGEWGSPHIAEAIRMLAEEDPIVIHWVAERVLDGELGPPPDDADSVAEKWLNALENAVRDERLEQLELLVGEKTPDVHTINQAVELFLGRMEAKARVGEIAAGYFDILKRCLDHFADHVRRRASVNAITEMTLESYHTLLLKSLKCKGGDGWSADYIDGYLRAMKRFVRWAWRGRLLKDLPRNIDSRDIGISKPDKRIKPWRDEDISTMLAHASERTRLFLMLMLNCGVTQKDISDLNNEEMDWERGRIIRKRGKTKKFEGVPEVEYALWPETLALLKKFGSRSGRVLSNEDGGPLKVKELRTVNGKPKVLKLDNIAVAFGRLIRKLTKRELLKEPKSLKFFRKTSHSKIGNNPEFAHLKQYFLGHSARTVADKNYFAMSQDAFDRAISWLRNEYKIAEIKEPPKEKERKKRKRKGKDESGIAASPA